MRYEIRSERGHYVVYLNGIFYGSYDSYVEALKDMEEAG